jgi:hypothetical protein
MSGYRSRTALSRFQPLGATVSSSAALDVAFVPPSISHEWLPEGASSRPGVELFAAFARAKEEAPFDDSQFSWLPNCLMYSALLW